MNRLGDLPTMFASSAEREMYGVEAGDLVVAEGGDVGRTAFVPKMPSEVIIQNSLHRLRTTRADLRYVRFALDAIQASGWLDVLCNKSTFGHLTREKLSALRIPAPDRATQIQIADFLDAETARVDALIEKKRRMITLLREHFVSLRRVTFDRLANQHREIALRRVTTCLDGRRIPLNAEARSTRNGPYPYWGAGTIVDRIDDYLFDEPLVLLGEDGAPFFDLARDVAFHVTEPVWVNNHIHVLRPEHKWSPPFLTHMLNAVDFSQYITGSTRDKLTQAEMDNIRLPATPLEQQQDVVAELDGFSARATAVRQKLERQIALLLEHRQALMTAAVTGQLDVAKAPA
jgi:type I restriction enzyme, S subunit